MVPDPLARARQLADELLAQLSVVTGPGAADDALLSALARCEGVARGVERASVGAIADLERRGVSSERGYRSTVTAPADLLGWERHDARRRLVVAEQACAPPPWSKPWIGTDPNLTTGHPRR
ncbi:MAG: hypothetical protein AB7J32_11405 [Pseudonocardia sp.]